MGEEQCRKVVAALTRRGYEAIFVRTRDEARALVLEAAESAASVGWGGSETLKEIGVREAVVARGKTVYDHRTDAELFLLSANALLADGRIVNVDGTGNRVAASVFGPKRVLYVIGRNKIVAGGLDDALARIRASACPPNARRLGRRTPCAAGPCDEAACPFAERMCKVTVVFDAPPSRTPTTVIVVDEDLGY